MTELLTVVPSLYLAYQLVAEEIFKARATQFVQSELEQQQSHVVSTRIDPKAGRIEVSLVGEVVPQGKLAGIIARLPGAGLADTELMVYQTVGQHIDVANLKNSLLGDLYKDSQAALAQRDKSIERLRGEIGALQGEQQRFHDIPAELQALYPQIREVLLAEAPDWHGDWTGRNTVMPSLRVAKPLRKADRARIEQWLRARLKTDAISLMVATGSTQPR